MAQVRSRVTVEVLLTLSEEEARWLRDMLQNPLAVNSLNVEPMPDGEYRKGIWMSLDDGLKNPRQ